jgi:hypothetical protein
VRIFLPLLALLKKGKKGEAISRSRSNSTGSDTSQITIKDIRIRTPSPIASSSRKLEDITPPISRIGTHF